MRQRAMIAMALVNDPKLLIADEPTTALDVTVQAQILDLIARPAAEFGSAVIIITHDLGVVAEIADDILVMYGGRCVEQRPGRATIFYRPEHPYTWGLLGSMPRLDRERPDRLHADPGLAAEPDQRPSGCAFHPRCAVRPSARATVPHRAARLLGGRRRHRVALPPAPDRAERIWTEEIAAEAVSDRTASTRRPPMPGEPAPSDAGGRRRRCSRSTDLQKHFPSTAGIVSSGRSAR